MAQYRKKIGIQFWIHVYLHTILRIMYEHFLSMCGRIATVPIGIKLQTKGLNNDHCFDSDFEQILELCKC